MTGATAIAKRLPELRQDLRITSNAVDLSGERYWKIYDPLDHRYTALGGKDLAMLDAWSRATTPDEVIEAVWVAHSELVTHDDVAAFERFLLANGLAVSRDPGAWRQPFAQNELRRSRHLSNLVKSYLFLKVPLANPESFLRSTLPLVRPLASPLSLALLLVVLVADVLLVLREWDQFASSTLRLANWNGVLGLVPAVLFVKLLHELAHGYVATHFQCRVQSIGVAFMVGAPLLYVDVTDSWKVRSARANLLIDGAGIAVDLGISILATLAWAFLPEGLGRSIAFSLATAGWLTSITFNLNPFMRFDGYHLLADAIGMPNMQTRAMALSRWHLREVLFGLRVAAPEPLAPRARGLLVAYGYGVWGYRAVVFFGIALVVYAFFFKLLGLALFAVEIIYFILGPVWHEAKEWFAMRQRILASRRSYGTLVLVAAFFAVLAMPWSTTVRLAAVLEPAVIAEIHLPLPARLTAVAVEEGMTVAKGAPLFSLASASLQHELETTRLRARSVALRLDRLMSDAKDREQAIVLQQERLALDGRIAGVEQRLVELRVAAPIDGVVARVVEYAAPGRWVTPGEPLVVIQGSGGMRIRGLVDADDRVRLAAGMAAVFIANDVDARRVPAVVANVSTANVSVIDQVALAQSFGGNVPSVLDRNRKAVPVAPHYAVTADVVPSLDGSAAGNGDTRLVAGVLHVTGERQSMLARVWRRILIVLVRESGL